MPDGNKVRLLRVHIPILLDALGLPRNIDVRQVLMSHEHPNTVLLQIACDDFSAILNGQRIPVITAAVRWGSTGKPEFLHWV